MSSKMLIIIIGGGVGIILLLLAIVIIVTRILHSRSDDEKEYVSIEIEAQRLLVYETIKMMEKIRGEIEKIERTLSKDKNIKKYAQKFTDDQARAGDFDQAVVGSEHASKMIDRIRKKEEMIDLFQNKLKQVDNIYEMVDEQHIISQSDFETIYKVLNLSERNEAEVKNLLELIEHYTSYVSAPGNEQKEYKKKKGYHDNLEMYKAKKFHIQVEVERLKKTGKTDAELEPLFKLLSEINFRIDKLLSRQK